MSTLRVDISQTFLPFNRTDQVLPNDSRHVAVGKVVNIPRNVHSRPADANNDQSAKIDDFTIINPLARSISIADRAIEVLDKHIERAKVPLQAIVKNYPPFSPEDSERLNYLKSFIGLRMEIEQLMVPPDKDVERIITDIKKINLLELSLTATDKDIAAAIDGLDAATHALDGTRAVLADFAVTSGSKG